MFIVNTSPENVPGLSLDVLEFYAFRLQESFDVTVERERRLGVVARNVADVHVQRDERDFRPGMDGDVGFRQNVDAGERVFSERVVFSGHFGEPVFCDEGSEKFSHSFHPQLPDAGKVATVEVREDMGSGRYLIVRFHFFDRQ